jgi:4-amino-4-deoxy-L-arabinose transferase-like glycosyltransferase
VTVARASVRRPVPVPRAAIRAVHYAVVALLLLFWGLTLAALDRSPRVNEGEALITSLGYKLFTRGIYGTDLFAGFHGMEQHFFIITPLMSLLEGANTRLLGMGLFQWRLLAAMAGVLTLALTFRVGRWLVGVRAALLALTLLVGWQWAHAEPTQMTRTGIPLMDVARIVRHDILVAPLGLAAWWAFLRQRRTGRWPYALLAGVLTGLAGLAHVYGLFWAAAFLLCLLVEGFWRRRAEWRTGLWILTGTLACWLPVAAFIWPYPADFAAQSIQSRGRFELLSPRFYLDNVLSEVHRYSFGWHQPGALLSPGAWVLLLGLPAAWLGLAWQAAGRKDGRALWLAAPALVLPLLLAVLIKPKTYNYLVAVAPVFALLLAWGVTQLVSAAPRAGRILVVAGVAVLLAQGTASLVRATVVGAAEARPADTYTQLRALIPPGARVIGHQQYWPGLYDRTFRSFGVAFMLAGPDMNPTPVSFRQALEQTQPEYVLIDPVMRAVFEDWSSAEAASNTRQFWAFMDAHRAQLVTTITSGAETPLEVYRLQW